MDFEVVPYPRPIVVQGALELLKLIRRRNRLQNLPHMTIQNQLTWLILKKAQKMMEPCHTHASTSKHP